MKPPALVFKTNRSNESIQSFIDMRKPRTSEPERWRGSQRDCCNAKETDVKTASLSDEGIEDVNM